MRANIASLEVTYMVFTLLPPHRLAYPDTSGSGAAGLHVKDRHRVADRCHAVVARKMGSVYRWRPFENGDGPRTIILDL